MGKLKILIANDNLEIGGKETLIVDFVRYYCQEYSRSNLELVLLHGDGRYLDQIENLIKVNIFNRERKFDTRYLNNLRKYLKENNFDVIHIHSPIIGFYLFIAGIGLRINFVQTIHGFFDRRSPAGKIQPTHLILTIIISRFVSRNIFVSNYLLKEYKKMGISGRNSIVIQNGVDFTKFNLCVTPNSSRTKIQNKVIFGMVGNFNNVRSHKTLINAFAKLLLYYKDIILLFAGDGELLLESKKIVNSLKLSNHVFFYGTLRNISEFLNSINCFVYSSRTDTFGIAVIEAMYAGVPVIVSDNGPFSEISVNGIYANLFDAEDEESLFEIMHNFMIDNRKFKSKAMTTREYVKKHYSIKNNVDHTIAIYQEILKNH